LPKPTRFLNFTQTQPKNSPKSFSLLFKTFNFSLISNLNKMINKIIILKFSQKENDLKNKVFLRNK